MQRFCLPVKCRTARFLRRDACESDVGERTLDRRVLLCPACSQAEESLSHLLFECTNSLVARTIMFDRINEIPGCASKLQACLSIQDDKELVLHFTSGKFVMQSMVLKCQLWSLS